MSSPTPPTRRSYLDSIKGNVSATVVATPVVSAPAVSAPAVSAPASSSRALPELSAKQNGIKSTIDASVETRVLEAFRRAYATPDIHNLSHPEGKRPLILYTVAAAIAQDPSRFGLSEEYLQAIESRKVSQAIFKPEHLKTFAQYHPVDLLFQDSAITAPEAMAKNALFSRVHGPVARYVLSVFFENLSALPAEVTAIFADTKNTENKLANATNEVVKHKEAWILVSAQLKKLEIESKVALESAEAKAKTALEAAEAKAKTALETAEAKAKAASTAEAEIKKLKIKATEDGERVRKGLKDVLALQTKVDALTKTAAAAGTNNTSITELQAKIAEKDAIIAEKDTLIAEKDATIALRAHDNKLLIAQMNQSAPKSVSSTANAFVHSNPASDEDAFDIPTTSLTLDFAPETTPKRIATLTLPSAKKSKSNHMPLELDIPAPPAVSVAPIVPAASSTEDLDDVFNFD